MNPSRNFVCGIIALGLPLFAQDASAVRYAERPLLWNRTAVSGYAGAGYPVGNFASDDLDYDGAHEANWPLDWSVEVEHFVGRTWSLGFSAAYTTYEDKDFPELETNLNTYSGFLRIVVPSGTDIRPYFRAGMGAMQLESEVDGAFRFDAEYVFSFQAGAGLLWLPQRWLGLNLQALYYYGSTEDAYYGPDASVYFEEDVPIAVGYDTTYFVFAAGVSLFFP
ncbi:MAG TPA: outer membrane beta-barrel protein [Candidatus Krumholzibacteria bacterium]|nr:outer membrane beta-barrel protein [Candidatus Krumholzibacteria bacterium]